MATVVKMGQERVRQALEMTLWRKSNLLTQYSFAAALGISRRCIQGIESAKHTPHPGTYKLFVQLRDRYKRRKQMERDAGPPMTGRQKARLALGLTVMTKGPRAGVLQD